MLVTSPPEARKLTRPLPDGCSDRYAAGWVIADWFVSQGGDLNADAPGDWHEEKVVGFWDRLTAEREHVTSQVGA